MQGFNVQIGADVSSFNAGVQKVQQQLQKLPNVTNQSTLALSNLSRVAQDAPYGFIGIANNINPLLESFQRLKASTGSTGSALKSMAGQLMGPAGIGLAVGVVSSLLVTFGDRLFGAGRAANEAENSMKKLRDATKGVFENAGKEAAEVNSLIAVLKNETETRERKLLAIKELQRIQPDVFNSIKLEGSAVTGLDLAYKGYIENLKLTIAVKLRQLQLERLLTKQLELQGATQTKSIQNLLAVAKEFENKRLAEARGKGDATGAWIISQILGSREARDKELKQLQSDIDAAFKDMIELSKGVELTAKPDKITIKPDKIKIDASGSVFEGLAEAFSGLTRTQIGIPETFIKTAIDGLVKSPDFTKLNDVLANNQAKALDGLRERWVSLAQQISSVVAPAFNEFIDSITKGENAFRAFGELVANVLKSVIAQLLQTAIVAGILSLISGGMGAKGGFSFAQAFSRISGFKAGGGGVGGNRSYIVGERGPELFVPSTSGRIVPNHQLNSISGGAMQMVRVMVQGQVSGKDLRLIQVRQEAYEGRNV